MDKELVARAPTLNQLNWRSSDHLQMAPTSRFRQRGSRQALITKIAAIEDTAKITDSYILMMRLW